MYLPAYKVALDSNSLSYLIDALGSFDRRPTGRTVAEKIALARCFIYRGEETIFCITPTVRAEYSRISSQERLTDHAHWSLFHLQELTQPSNTADIIFRTNALSAHHSDIDDCRIVAECEALDVSVFLTSDRKLRNSMKRLASKVNVMSGRQFWEAMAIAPRSKPTIELNPNDPLNDATWWRV